MSHPGRPHNTMDLDGLSLQQALRDFEVANARVIDLTQRLLASEDQRRQLADELERARQRIARLETPTRLQRGLDVARGAVRILASKLRN